MSVGLIVLMTVLGVLALLGSLAGYVLSFLADDSEPAGYATMLLIGGSALIFYAWMPA